MHGVHVLINGYSLDGVSGDRADSKVSAGCEATDGVCAAREAWEQPQLPVLAAWGPPAPLLPLDSG